MPANPLKPLALDYGRASDPPRVKKACHNCRRRRLRCDRSHPVCRKCTSNGEECLGYGQLFRWTHAVASRGKMAGLPSFGESPDQHKRVLLAEGRYPEGLCYIVDPLLKDISPRSRYYVRHFTDVVCRDLVSFDQRDRNPFRFMLPMMGQFSYLKEIVVATSAIHLVARRRSQDEPVGSELVDALVARAQAIKLLQVALDNIDDYNRPAVLAAVVFFVNFELIDSGRGGWKAHLEAAGTLIRSLHRGQGRKRMNQNATSATMMGLSDMVMADCLTYHILGSTLSALDENAVEIYDGIDVPDVLQRAQAHSYHCCPPDILRIVAQASRIPPVTPEMPRVEREKACATAAFLYSQALAVDVRAWVESIGELSPDDDRDTRISVASAHRSASCLYVLLCVPLAAHCFPGRQPSPDALVDEILLHLLAIPAGHELFKGTVWPAFMAGAQTDDLGRREWCLGCIRSLWAVSRWTCPWGYVNTAAQMLQQVWAARDAQPVDQRARWNWLTELKSNTESCLIV